MSLRTGYEDVDTLRDPDGIIGIISRRRSTNVYSVAIMKEFERDGVIERSAFIQAKHIPNAKAIMDRCSERIADLVEQGPSEPPLAYPARAGR